MRLRSSTPAEASPIPVSVLTSDEAALRPSVTAADAMALLPGVALVRDGAWETSVSIRGMSRSNIVMMVDNTRIETAADISGALSLIDVCELERVELVRSPGSSLWGSGPLGGVVHLMTKQPSFSSSSASHVQIDEAASGVNGLVSHHAAFEHSSPRAGARIALGFRNAGSTRTPEGVIAHSQFRDMNLSASLGVKAFDDQTLSVLYQRSQAENAGIPGSAPIASQASARYTMARRELLSAEYAMPELSPAIALLAVRVSRQRIERNVEIIQSPALTLTPHAVHTTTSGEIESRLALAPALHMTAGIDCWERTLDSRRERVNTALAQTVGERPVPVSSFLSAGSYVHAMWSMVPERVTFDAGARFDLIRVTNDAASNPDYAIGPDGVTDLHPSGQALLWKEGTVWNRSWSASGGVTAALASWADLSCLAAAAFRSPSLEERFQFIDLGSIVRVGDPALRPEQSASLDLGLSLHTARFTLRADAFLNRLTDLVTEIPGTFEGRPALVKANIGEALMSGVELGGAQQLSDRFSLRYSLTYVRGEDRRLHAPLPQIPPLSAQLSANAFFPSAGMFSLDVRSALRQDRVAAGELATPGFGVIDCRYSSAPVAILAAESGAELVVRCGVENLLDTSYRLHVSTLRGIVRQEPGRNLYAGVSVTL